MQKKILTILVCPLDWGLGHASRMIPLIHHFTNKGHYILLGGSGKSLELLKKEFPEHRSVAVPNISISYSKGNLLFLKLIFQLPKMLFGLIREHLQIRTILKNHHVDIIISDNRYGLWNKNVHTVFVTHQLSPVLPAILKPLEPLLHIVIKKIISRYDECWVPDYADPDLNLAGILAHRFALPVNAKYIGPLSRFSQADKSDRQNKKPLYDLVVILSGPEPQRSVFENKVLQALEGKSFKTVIIRGLSNLPLPSGYQKNNTITFYSHLATAEFAGVLHSSRLVVCRSGYSNIMDLVELQIPAIIVPTPGQTEQEYLAKHLGLKGFFLTLKQNEINLSGIISDRARWKGFPFRRADLSGLRFSLKTEYHHHGNKSN